ncbi:MAG: mechanosensitive ion channel [Candidatus Sericytochromatia bacterium]|nr:mechanosensitive ion channel [Candidatus Sericytochromatia bacterium]
MLPAAIGHWLPVLVTLIVALTARVVLVRMVLSRFTVLAGSIGKSYLRRVDGTSLIIVGVLTAQALFKIYRLESSFTLGYLLLIGCSVYIVVETIKCFLVDYHLIHRQGRAVPRLLINVAEVVLFGVLFLSLSSSIYQVNLTPFLATSAVLSAVIGLALQDTLGSLFAGLSLQADKPFRPGDWVEIAGFLGEVREVTWRSTKLRTRRNELIVLPNNRVAKTEILNYSQPSLPVERFVTIGLAYDLQPNQVKAAVLDALSGLPGVLETPRPDVRVLKFQEYSVEYQVIYWITDFHGDMRIAAGVRSALWYVCKRQGMRIPFPVRHISIQSEPVIPDSGDGREVMAALSAVDFLRVLPAESLVALADHISREVWSAGETVFQEGAAGDSLYVVLDGALRVEAHSPEGEPVALGELGPGNVIGEMSLLTGEPRSASIVCQSDVTLLRLPKAALQPRLQAHPELLSEISRIISVRMEANEALLNAHAQDALVAQEADERSRRLSSRIRQFFNLPA